MEKWDEIIIFLVCEGTWVYDYAYQENFCIVFQLNSKNWDSYWSCINYGSKGTKTFSGSLLANSCRPFKINYHKNGISLNFLLKKGRALVSLLLLVKIVVKKRKFRSKIVMKYYIDFRYLAFKVAELVNFSCQFNFVLKIFVSWLLFT